MRVNLSKEERDELNSLKRDLLEPMKSFAAEVGSDTVGDARRFYAAKAKKAKQSAELAREKAKAQAEAFRQEQEQLRRQRKRLAKRALLVLALLALFSIVVISAALSAHAEAADNLAFGKSCPAKSPHGYENAALCCTQAARKTAEQGYTGIIE